MKVIMALSQIICLVLATVVCVSGLPIDQTIQAAYESTGRPYTFNQTDGTIIAELDIRMDKEDWERLYGSQRAERMTGKGRDKIWTNGTIPYLISNIFSEDQRSMIEESMEVWANNTCLEFREKTRGDRNYVVFTNGLLGCTSFVGMNGGSQRIDLATACMEREVIIHEIGHAIGLFHEHSRPDRDNYITINESNVDPNFRGQIKKVNKEKVSLYDVSYDLTSIMQYGKLYFSINGHPTIVPKDDTFLNAIGQSNGPSFGDLKTVNTMYQCHEQCPKKKCPCNGFMTHDCECMCPGDAKTGPPIIRCSDATEGPCLLGAIQENMKKQERTIIDLQKGKQDTERKLGELQNEINKTKSLTAFHVCMKKFLIYPNKGDVIPFNGVITNIGGGFNTTTHKFRCPVSGVYAFWFALWTGHLPYNGKRQTIADLMIDDTGLSRVYCKNDGSDHVYLMCSQQAVTVCQAGSHVWVQSGTSDVKLYGSASRETTFSGFLLREN